MNPFGSPFQQSMQWNAQVQAASRRLQMGSVWLRQQRERLRSPYLTNSPSPRPLTFWQKLKEFDRKCDEWLGFK